MSLRRVEYNPLIAALAGPSLSGKTTLGREIEQRTNLEFFDIDEAGLAVEGVLGQLEIRRPFLTSMWMTVKYAHLQYQAAKVLAEGRPVLLAATYSHETYHYMLRTILADTFKRLEQPEAVLRIFALDVPEESLLARVEERSRAGSSASSVYTLDHAVTLRRKFAPIQGDDVTLINTGLSLEENVAQVLQILDPYRRMAA